MVQLAVVVPDDKKSIPGARSYAYRRVDDPSILPAAAPADAPASLRPRIALPSSPPVTVAAAVVGVVVVANALLAGPIISPVTSGGTAHTLTARVATQPALT